MRVYDFYWYEHARTVPSLRVLRCLTYSTLSRRVRVANFYDHLSYVYVKNAFIVWQALDHYLNSYIRLQEHVYGSENSFQMKTKQGNNLLAMTIFVAEQCGR